MSNIQRFHIGYNNNNRNNELHAILLSSSLSLSLTRYMRHSKDIFHCHIWISFLDSCLFLSVIPDWFLFNQLIVLFFLLLHFFSFPVYLISMSIRYFYEENRFQSMRNWKVITLKLQIIKEETTKQREKKSNNHLDKTINKIEL